MEKAKEKEMDIKTRKNIIDYTKELINVVGDDSLDEGSIVSISFIYRNGKDKKKIKGLNVQAYGHMLYIVPDVNDIKTVYNYITHDEGMANEDCRRSIFEDLIDNKHYSRTDAAKLMKCSVATVNRILGDK